jgi:methylglyoxal synthase
MNGNLPESLMILFGLAIGGGLWPLVRRTHKNMSNVEILSDFKLRAQGGQSAPPPSWLVAHDNQKERMARWALKQKTRLLAHELYATSHTADVVGTVLNTPVIRLLSGPLGGDQQIGSRIAESKIDVLVFFWEPLVLQPHDCDVKALLRLATAYNIPNACNEATADCIISALAEE